MSASSSKQQSQTSNPVTQIDKRVGLEGTGNIVAGDGASVTLVDTSDALVERAFDSADAVLDAAGNVIGFGKYVSALNAETTADFIDAGKFLAGRAFDSAADFSDASLRLAEKVIAENADLTEATRTGNAQLAGSFVDRAITGIADSRRDTNEKLISDGIKYGAAAFVVGAVVLGVAVFKSK